MTVLAKWTKRGSSGRTCRSARIPAGPIRGEPGPPRHSWYGQTRAGLLAVCGSGAARHLVFVGQMRAEGVLAVILPKDRDPRFVTIRRGGILTDSDHHFLALWAASCAEHVLDLFESTQPDDPRPREAIEHARAWVLGEVTMMQARAAGDRKSAV